MKSSHVGLAEDKLYELLTEHSAIPGNALEGVSIGRGNPLGKLGREEVWIGENTTSEQEWEITGSGSQAKREIITVEVNCWVARGEGDYHSARDRALAMAAEVESLGRSDWTLEGVAFDASVMRIGKTAGPVEYGQAVLVTVEWQILAWLS